MDGSFDFSRVLKNHDKKHKKKPAQFMSVAEGVLNRLDSSIKHRRSSRLSIFDRLRNLPQSASPVVVSIQKSKVEHRRQQLEKWKEDKEKRKKEQAVLKKKPFVTGVAHAPLKFVPPPPPPKKPVPSTSGRVTRSQSAKIIKPKNTIVEPEPLNSFAPKNASFKPPSLQNIPKLQLGAPKAVTKKSAPIKFEPVITNNVKQTRSRTNLRNSDPKVILTRLTDGKSKIKVSKPDTNPKRNLQSSSSSEKELTSPTRKTKATKSTSNTNSSTNIAKQIIPKSIKIKNSNWKSLTDSKRIPKNRVPKSESSSEERLRSPKSPLEAMSSEEQSEDISPEKTIRSQKSLKDAMSKSLEAMVISPRRRSPKSLEAMSPSLRSPKSPEVVAPLSSQSMTPEQIVQEAKKFSPCVTMSRGKDNARREMKQKLNEGLLDEDASDMESVELFRKQLASEIKRMTGMCDTWDRILQQNVVPDAVQECVLGAVGQARLLMSAKLVQFATLVERCARPEPGAALVTPADLHGFWDMVFMQVENVDMRFKKLEEMRARGWQEEQPVTVEPKVVKPSVKPGIKRGVKPGAKAVKPSGGTSKLKEMIAAARKAKKEQEQPPTPTEENKSFEAGFFSVLSPVRTSYTTNTPQRKNSLLKAVLSSEAKKSASKNAPFAMLRASLMCKNLECDGIAPLPVTPKVQINLATPGRSILKQKMDTGKKSANKKSIKVVLFDESDHELNQSMDDKLNARDSGLSSMDVENLHLEEYQESKENSRRKSKLVRQDAVEERSTVMTRSRRRSNKTPQADTTPRKSRSEKLLQTTGSEKVLKERTGSEKVLKARRSDQVLQDLDSNVSEKETPKRSLRRRKNTEIQEITA